MQISQRFHTIYFLLAPHCSLALPTFAVAHSLPPTLASLLSLRHLKQNPNLRSFYLSFVWNTLPGHALDFFLISFRSWLKYHHSSEEKPSHPITNCTYVELHTSLYFSSEHSSPSNIYVYYLSCFLYLLKSKPFEDEDLFCFGSCCNTSP